MKPHELKPPAGSHKRRKRVGRGEGSGKGKTSGRGSKGTKARGNVAPFFEGGQMPLTRRVPKLKGFKNPSPTVYQPVNIDDLERIGGSDIGPDQFRAAGLIRRRAELVKVLGRGEVSRKLTVRAHACSQVARQKIEGAGGSVELIDASTPGASS